MSEANNEPENLSDLQQAVDIANEIMDLTIVYNRHVSVEDANEAMAHIEPDSCVFIEGYKIDTEDNILTDAISYLNRIRLTVGKDVEYFETKEIILSSLEQEVDTPVTGPLDFSKHRIARLQYLLRNDCVINIADYSPMANAQSEDDASRLSIHEQFVQDIEAVDDPWLFNVEPSDSKYKVLRAAMRTYQNETSAHAVREISAHAKVVSDIIDIHSLPGAETLRKTPEGKLKTYLCYGGAHAKSLTAQFKKYGTDPKIIEVMSIDPYRYLDVDPKAAFENRRRRVAHTALILVSCVMPAATLIQEIARDSYEGLEHVNADKEAYVQFMVTCIEIWQRCSKEQDQTGNYLSLLRSVIPDPKQFVGKPVAIPSSPLPLVGSH